MTDAHDVYSSAEGVRPAFGEDEVAALAYVRRYVEFAQTVAPPPGDFLDVGCGAGWSTLALKRAGYRPVGLDVHVRPEALAADGQLAYVRADATALPFGDNSFDAVGLYQSLEHMREPRRVLGECRRVLRPGGLLIVVGPNLESPALAALVNARLMLRRATERTPDLGVHPYGNVTSEARRELARVLRASRSSLRHRPARFETRVPDAHPPFHADNDATWFCNPADLLAWSRETGLRPVRWWSDRRFARLWWRLAAGTWVALERP
jgi:SAM-dependent methyltransferase